MEDTFDMQEYFDAVERQEYYHEMRDCYDQERRYTEPGNERDAFKRAVSYDTAMREFGWEFDDAIRRMESEWSKLPPEERAELFYDKAFFNMVYKIKRYARRLAEHDAYKVLRYWRYA